MSTGIEMSRRIIARHSKSFSLARRLLPASCRDDAAVVYAWCRRADDAVDDLPARQARLALARLERELDDIYRGEGQRDPLARAFQDVVERTGIPRVYPRDLLRGMRMDLEGTRYETLGDLYLYCYRVAGTVGLMMCHVMGVHDPRALRHAAHLGMAMQLTNVCRDVLEDWERNRLYLPVELMPELGARPLAGRNPGQLSHVLARAVARLLREADAFYASGDEGLSYLSLRARWAVHSARLVYSRIGTVIRTRGCDVMLGRAVVPLVEKLTLVLGASLDTLKTLPARLVGRRTTKNSLPQLRFPRDVLPV